MKRDLRATWLQGIGTLFAPVIVVLCIRWVLFEPFVIPSESMVPTLLIHDHIFASKLAYGLRMPFGSGFIWRWGSPHRGDIVVFKFPLNPDVFYVKRAIGLPGDRIKMQDRRVWINGEALPLEQQGANFLEGIPPHKVRYISDESGDFSEVVVPPEHFFMMGDNRDRSSDSRVWGYLPIENVVGRASLIWLSCDQTLSTAQMMCDPATMRWQRMFKGIH